MDMSMSQSADIMTGSQVIAKALWHQGVRTVFGLVGFPVFNIAQACIDIGMEFIALRNEQSASYAASAFGYLEGKPAVLVVVPGPGVIHALAGMANSTENGWPLVVFGGGNPTYLHSMGGFQEMDQVGGTRPYTKFSITPPSIADIPRVVEKAYRISWYGRPGATFVDCPADYLFGNIKTSQVDLGPVCPPPPRPLADPTLVHQAADLLLSAKSPLIIVGKGSQMSRAEQPIQQLVDLLQCPFLPTPMGKGVVPDSHKMNISAARSTALKGADVVLLLGGRANWILHHLAAPKFNPNVKIIQVDIEAEELHNNTQAAIGLCGDLKAIAQQLLQALQTRKSSLPLRNIDAWKSTLTAATSKAGKSLMTKASSKSLPMSYHVAFQEIKQLLPSDHVFVSEGSNTMDIGRSFFEVQHPRSRLDAGSYATMGLGLGYAVAAALHYPNRRIINVEGDSAFGFSGMEIETMARYKLPVIIIIINNNGIGAGIDKQAFDTFARGKLPASVLSVGARYERMAEVVGGKGYHVETPEALRNALKTCLADTTACPAIINCIIEPQMKTEAAGFTWLAAPKESKL